jgi:hypothetical protein
MKIYSLLIMPVVCCGISLVHSPSYAQGRSLTREQLNTAVRADLDVCAPPVATLRSGRTDPSTIIPTSNTKAIPTNRIARTLQGIWQGRVLGDDGHAGVDYFWINDMQRNEGLIIAQRSGKETVQQTARANAPKFSYVMCAHDGYFPSKDTPQVHEFVKASDSIADAAKVIEQATGVKIQKPRPTLQDLWNNLVAVRYFSDPRYADQRGYAYAGGFFKPMAIQPIANAVGPAQVALKWDAVYRGGGQTSIRFTPDVPIQGVEYAQFVGTTTDSGDYLVSSPGNGRLWKVEALRGGQYDLAFDKVVVGPLAQ